MGYPANPIDDDAIVILLDPDQMILRPFTNNDFSNTVWSFEKNPRSQVTHGNPMGQLYGFGIQWKTKIDMNQIAPSEQLPSPVDKLTSAEAKNFIVGYVRYFSTITDELVCFNRLSLLCRSPSLNVILLCLLKCVNTSRLI
jgi:hypothetical protein